MDEEESNYAAEAIAYAEALEQAYPLIGKTIAALSNVEFALDCFLRELFENQFGFWKTLPRLDFRSKVELLEGWIEIFERPDTFTKIRHRLHDVYNHRNTIAHGYIFRDAEFGVVFKHERSGKTIPIAALGGIIEKLDKLHLDLLKANKQMRALNARREKFEANPLYDIAVGLAGTDDGPLGLLGVTLLDNPED